MISLTELITRADLEFAESAELLETLAGVLPEHIISAFAKSHIAYDDAVNIAVADDSFFDEFLEHNRLEPYKLATLVTQDSLKDFAYNLVHTHSGHATELFEELLYYRNKGVI